MHCNAINAWSQRSLRLGGLQRGRGNVLLDPNDEDAYFEIHYRISPRLGWQPGFTSAGDGTNGNTMWEREQPQPASVINLARALDSLSENQQLKTKVFIYMNGFGSGVIHDTWRRWIQAAFDLSPGSSNGRLPCYSIDFDESCPLGNMASFQYMLDKATERKSESLTLDQETLVMLMEDDVMLLNSALVEVLSLFRTHNPCFVSPMDNAGSYTQRSYNPNDGNLTIIAALRRHWRDKASVTCTYIARRETMREALRREILPNPKDDFGASMRLQAAGATIVSPMPGIAASVENVDRYDEESIGLYIDWRDIALQAIEAGELVAAYSALPWPLPTDIRSQESFRQ